MKRRFYIFFFLLFKVSIHLVNGQNIERADLFLIFNQPKYAIGDTAYFRGKLVLQNFQPLTGMKLINLRLVNSNNETVKWSRVVFQNGYCANQLKIDETISPGLYSLIAYSDEYPQNYSSIPFPIVDKENYDVDDSNSKDSVLSNARIIATISTDKPIYKRREKVTVQIKITDEIGDIIGADNVISVIHKDFLYDSSKNNVGLIHGQFKVSFDNKKGNGLEFPSYFQGRVSVDSIPVSKRDSILITFYLSINDLAYGIVAKQTGEFRFPLFKEFGDEEVFYTITRKGVPLNAQLKFDDNKIFSIKPLRKIESKNSDLYYKLSMDRRAIYRSYFYYLGGPNGDSDDFDDWMVTDFEINMDDYEPFQSMKEVLSNILQTVKYINRGKGDVRVFMKKDGMFANKSPLYLINGVMVDDSQYFLNINPENVQRIGVLRSQGTLARFGELGKNGIILVETRLPMEEYKKNKILFVKGITEPIQFQTPIYSDRDKLFSRVPDMRTTLYWNPRLVSKSETSQFSFYTGDAVGTFNVVISGFTPQGKFFQTTQSFSVSK